jgi:hypothetical protein
MKPRSRRAAEACWTAARWVPVEAQTWPYMRRGQGGCDGIGEMPYEHDDRQEFRSFAKAHDGRAWGVQIRTTRTHPTPCRGYRVTSEPRRR